MILLKATLPHLQI